VVCVLVGWLRGAIDPAGPPGAASPATATLKPTTPVPVPAPASAPTPQPAIPALPPPQDAPELHGHDTADPCTAGWEPAIPAGYDTVMADGVTVAWPPGPAVNPGPYDVTVKPTAIAYLANGLLEEAAALTGTPRRERLLVIIYPSKDSFTAATHAPAWADGLYDGGAVRLAIQSNTELGVLISTLRHELMHAQLHTAAGCMPAWFNEGVAMYFAGTPPARPWVRMLRNPDGFDLASLQVPTLEAMPKDRAERAYAESLAMIVFLVERSGEPGLKAAVAALRAASRESPRAGLDLWDRLYPGTGHRAVLDSLAHKLFGVSLGSELDALWKGAICCYGLRAVSEMGCRAAPPRPDKTAWLDQASAPRAACYATW
jgi:hypothetical protein